MSRSEAWRGERRLRVQIELGPRAARVRSMWLVGGPAVQQPELTRDLVARVEVDGATVLLQEFDDPRVERSVAQPGVGHHYGLAERGTVEVDVPLPGDAPAEQISIRIADLASVRARPTEAARVEPLFDEPPAAMRLSATVTTDDLRAHPDFDAVASAIAGAPASPARYEIYRDRAGRWRWRLRQPGGEIVADSGGGYDSREACEADLRWVRAHAGEVSVTSLD